MRLTDSLGAGSGFLMSPVLLAFVAGAASASFVWYTAGKHQAIQDEDEEDDSRRGVHRWSSRIGELPSLRRRARWPWDRKHRSRSNSPGRKPSSPPNSQPSAEQTKSGFCIGSIFGLDVGGTLAKLIYFEQKAEPSDSEYVGNRERSYRASASAQAVLKARRGSMDDSELLSSYSSPASFRARSNTIGGVLTPQRLRKTISKRRSLKESGSSNAPRHSSASNADLSSLYSLRQESLPDDLNEYANSVNIPRTTFRSMESMHNIVLGRTKSEEMDNNSAHQRSAPESNKMDGSELGGGMRKSRSMFDLSKSRDHAEALDRFYNFARRLDSYREGVRDHKLSFYSRELGGEFHFIRFETRRMQNAMDLIRANNLHLNIYEMGATGGGAHKFASQWERELGIEMRKKDELDSLVAGMQFVLRTVVGECYTFRPITSSTSSFSSRDSSRSRPSSGGSDQYVGIPYDDEDDSLLGENGGTENQDKGDIWWRSRKVQRDAISYSSSYPYLLVTIGTGVSILRVDGPRKYERISGSTIGGGTYWGLIRLLTDCEDFEDVMRLAEHGDPSKVDMLVGDIYGGNTEALEKIGLPADLVASSFGKLVAKENPAEGLKEEDLARALLLMITINIGQVAYLNAQLAKTSRIYFVGNFLRQNIISQRRLAFAIDYWSKGETEGLFLEHEGYFGALGAFLLTQEIPHDFAGSRRNSQGSTPSGHGGALPPEPLHRRRQTVGSVGSL